MNLQILIRQENHWNISNWKKRNISNRRHFFHSIEQATKKKKINSKNEKDSRQREMVAQKTRQVPYSTQRKWPFYRYTKKKEKKRNY